MVLIHRTKDGAVQINELQEGIRFYLDVENNRVKITFGDHFWKRAFSITSTVIGVTGSDREFPQAELFFYDVLRFVETYMIGKLLEHMNDEEGDYLDLETMMLFLNLELEAMEEDWVLEHSDAEEDITEN